VTSAPRWASSGAALAVALCVAVPVTGAAAASVRDSIAVAADVAADSDVRDAALGAVVNQGAAAVPPLMELLNDPTPNVRAVAATALGRISLEQGDERALAPLANLFEHDADPVVRMNAALALGMTGNPKAVPPLAAALDTSDLQLRRIVAVALFQVNRREVIPPAVRRLQQETDPEVQRNLIRALGNLGAREELEALRRSETDPALLAEVEQQIGVAKMHEDLEGTAVRQVPRSHVLYAFFARMRQPLMLGAYVLLALPAAVLAIWSFLSTPLRGWPIRFGVVLLGVAAAIILGGLASIPGFSAGLGRPDPGPGVAILVLPFYLAVVTVPVVLCACFIRLAVGRSETFLNAFIWAGVYAVLQFGTWNLVPVILRGNYFWYGHHPGWETTQIGYVIGVALACAVVGAARAAILRVGGAGTVLDGMRPRPFAAVLAPCVVLLGFGYLILSIFAY
jgi:hypothetical protein